MRRPESPLRHRAGMKLQMTPLIDVVFLLLIFFLCTASFQPPEETLGSPLAEQSAGGAAEEIDPDQKDLEFVVVRVSIGDAGVVYSVDERPGDIGALRRMLKAYFGVDPHVPIILQSDPNVPLEEVVAALDIARGIGFADVQFAVDKK